MLATSLFKVLLWVGIFIILGSLFIPISLFLPLFVIGLLLIVSSIVQRSRDKKHTVPTTSVTTPSSASSPPISKPQKTAALTHKPLPVQTQPKQSFMQKIKQLFHKEKPVVKEPTIKHTFLDKDPKFAHVKEIFQKSLTTGQQHSPIQQPLNKIVQSEHPLQPQPKHTFEWENSSLEPAQTPPANQQPTVQDIRYSKTPSTTSPTQATPTTKQQPATSDQDLLLLEQYIQDCLKAKYPPEKIKAAALQAGWPQHLVDTAFTQRTTTPAQRSKKKPLIILGSLILLLVILLVVFYATDMLMLSDISALFSETPLEILIAGGVLLLIIIVVLVLYMTKLFKKRKQLAVQQQDKAVQEIKTQLNTQQTVQTADGSFQTDFDKLLQLVQERKKISLAEVAKSFNIPKEKAEDWGKILKEQDLLILNYPTVGEPELLWKKSTNTPSKQTT